MGPARLKRPDSARTFERELGCPSKAPHTDAQTARPAARRPSGAGPSKQKKELSR